MIFPTVSDYRERCERKPRRFNAYPVITESIPQFKQKFFFTAEQHEELHRRALSRYCFCKREHSLYHEQLVHKYGATKSYISGIGYAGLATEIELEKLRELAHDASTWADASHAHWRSAGKQTTTWRRFFNQTKEFLNV